MPPSTGEFTPSLSLCFPVLPAQTWGQSSWIWKGSDSHILTWGLTSSLQCCHCWACPYLFPSCPLSCQPHWGHVSWSRQSYQARGEDASQGWCSAWSTACGNTAVWEPSFSALLLLMPFQVNPCAESTAGLCSLWMWLCVLKAALPFLFHKGLLINVTYLGTQAAECMASYLSIWEWLTDPILFSGVTAGW